MTIVHLPKEIRGDNLEQACLKAAGELGYQVDSRDTYEQEYFLGPFKRGKEYQHTDITMVRDKIPFFTVKTIRRGINLNSFIIQEVDSTPEEVTAQYLEKVSQYL